MKKKTLVDIFLSRGKSSSRGITFIENGCTDVFVSYKDLMGNALKTLSFLQEKGVNQKSELVFQVEDNKTFLTIFWACILGGIIPVPLTIGHKEDHINKLFQVWKILKNPFLISTKKQLDKLEEFGQLNEFQDLSLKLKDTFIDVASATSCKTNGKVCHSKDDDIAFIQFSSGSTGNPKGVILTHKNLIVNTSDITYAAKYTSEDRMLSWMPLTHDMGLIGFHINPLICNMNQYLIPTSLFVRRPALWLDKATEYRATVLSSPNFGYKYLLKNCTKDNIYQWELSSVRILYNGAEPISEKLGFEFLDRLVVYGLKRYVMCPVYGLAEASLAVSISNLDNELTYCRVSRDNLEIGDRIAFLKDGKEGLTFVNVGKPINNCSLRITDNQDITVKDGIIGKIQIKGDNVTSGYYNNAPETAKVIKDGSWLDTGDLGFYKAHKLYITGRIKDIIFSNGQNFYPHDLERIAEEVDGVELNKIVFGGFFDENMQENQVVGFVFFRGKIETFVPLAEQIKKAINIRTGLVVNKMIPIKDIPRTTSGKLQRYKLIELYRTGHFKKVESEILIKQEELLINPLCVSEPKNPNEIKLYQIWKEVFKGRSFRIDQEFFDIGGNSLKAAEITMRVWREFQIDLPISTLYKLSTIRALAKKLGQLESREYRHIPLVKEGKNYPVSSVQKRLYYHWEVLKSSIEYNIPNAFKIKGDLDIPKLENAIKQLIKRHDSLRMLFNKNKTLSCSVLKTVDFTLNCIDFPKSGLEPKLMDMVKPFDLNSLPLFRIELLRLKKDDYILFVDFHHIISDGISIYNFLDELFLLYNDETLQELPVRYRDYCNWEKENLRADKLKPQEDYWLNQLEGELPVLQMPYDFPRPGIFSTEGKKMQFSFNKATVKSLKKLAKEQNCTLHVLMFSIYKLLLSKYTGQDDIVIGMPVAGRRHPDLLNLQGMFVNNLAIRTPIDQKKSFAELLQTQQKNFINILNNQDYPFEYVIQKINRQRDISRNPIFDTMFIYQNVGFPKIKKGNCSISRHFFDPGVSKFDLSLEIVDYDEVLRYNLEYSTKLFKKETIIGIADHFDSLIGQILNNPKSKLSNLSIITEDEYETCIKRFNATQYPYSKDSCIHQLFEQQVGKAESLPAIEFNKETISYKQLNDRANHLAILLRENGVTQGTIVGILLDRSPELIISILAILKAGGAYLPIAGDLPEERIDRILNDSRCGTVLTSSRYQSVIIDLLKIRTTNRGLSVLNLDEQDLISGFCKELENVNIPTDLAYIIYTSGTTGGPKGVMVEHRSLVNYIQWAAKTYIKDQAVSFPLYTSVSFDLTITSIFVPLVTGNKIVIYEDGNDFVLNDVINDNKVDIIKLTPSHLKLFMEGNQVRPASTINIKRFIVGGEALETRLAREIYDKFGGNVEIYNEYGPTEATIGCMMHQFDPKGNSYTVPIGIPISNTQIYVLDEFLKPVPKGVHGEMYISGDGVARGYLFNKELTNHKFIPNPFLEGRKMYKTGDVVKRLSSGELEFVRRSDNQVKINGYRVELSEIEHHLRSHIEVEDALTAIKKGQKNQNILCAYYQSYGKTANVLRESTLRAFMATKVPHYMIPVHFVPLEEVPLTKNGKIDYNALPVPATNTGEGDIQLPENKIEEVSLKIWEKILGEQNLSITHNFFELGGDSIKAVQIASRLNEKGIAVEVRDILIYQTIQQITAYAKMTNGASSNYEQGIVEGRVGPSPIASWFFNQDFKNPNYFNQSILLDLDPGIDQKRLEQAFRNVIERHDGLRINYDVGKRTLFYNKEHIERQLVIDCFEISDESELGDIRKKVHNTFNITTDLLIKVTLIRQGNRGKRLLITAHHLIIDGVSWRILMTDLYEIYRGLESKEDFNLHQKTATLIDWHNALRSYRLTDDEKQYWEGLRNIEFSIPQDFDTTDWRVKNLERVAWSLDKEQTDFLVQESHRAYGTDVPILLNTALALTLNLWTGGTRFIVELENHGRHLDGIDTSRTLGWFTSMYPILLELEGDSLGAYIKAIKEKLRKVPNHGVGYGIYTFLQGSASNAKGLTSEIRFNYLGQFGNELNNDLFSYDVQSTGLEIDGANHATTKLEWNCMVMDGVFTVELLYNSKAHKYSTIKSLLDSFSRQLLRILTNLKKENHIYFTPSDFEMVNLDQKELDALFD